MATIKPLAVLLCAAALLCTWRGAAAALNCKNQEVQLVLGNQLGGCNSATLAQDAIVVVDGATDPTKTTLAWAGPMPTVVAGNLFIFVGGVDYSYAAANLLEPPCTGTVKVKPCKAVCRDLSLAVVAGKAGDKCLTKVGAKLLDPTDLIDAASLSSAATQWTVTDPATGKQVNGGQDYWPGKWSVRTTIIYPNGESEISSPCTVTVRDATPYGPPVIDATKTCFYSSNGARKPNYRMPLTKFASLPGGASCDRMFLYALACDPVKRPRICLPQNQPSYNNTIPPPVNGIDIVTKNAKGRQPLTVTVVATNSLGQNTLSVGHNIMVYKTKALVPKGQACIGIGTT